MSVQKVHIGCELFSDKTRKLYSYRLSFLLIGLICTVACIVTYLHLTSDHIIAEAFARRQGGTKWMAIMKKFANSHSGRRRKLELCGKGRLGNQIFRFAALMGIVHKYKRKPIIGDRHEWLIDAFPNIDVETSTPGCHNSMYRVRVNKSAAYEGKAFEDMPDVDVCAIGYFQSWRYFDDVKQKIRTQLKFAERYRQRAETILYDLLGNETKFKTNRISNVVGIHVRRRDMLRPSNMKTPGINYYFKAVEYFEKRLKNVHFIVASDDIDWCKRKLSISPYVHFSTGDSPPVDMALLSMCDHVILSAGSFGWWSAWLAGGEVIYYKNCVRKGSALAKRFNSSDYFPSDWIPMTD